MLRRRRTETRRAAVWLVGYALLATAILFAGPPAMRAGGWWSDGPTSRLDPSRYAPTPSPGATAATGPGVPAATAVSAPDRALLAARVGAIAPPAAVGTTSAAILAEDGTLLLDSDAHAPRTPASSLKVLTSSTALSLLGADHVFTTRVVDAPDGIVLVGGGDPYLRGTGASTYPQRASIVDLAAGTAASLAAQGRTSVALAYDASLFVGDGWNPQWPGGYREFASATSALWIDEGIANGVHSLTPAADAAATFATLLRERGITVTAVTAGTAAAGAAELASVRSLPLDLIVQELLLHSDNDATEILFRHVAIASGRTGSIPDAQAAVTAELQKLGLWEDGMHIEDGSGLSRTTLATAAALAGAIHLGSTDPRFRALIQGLPTAAGDGTLSSRYDDPATEGAARGEVRAKTGTLTGVHTLTGTTQTKDGDVVTFGFMTNNVTDDWGARDWLEKVTAAVASCGCH